MTEHKDDIASKAPLLSVKNLRKEFGGLVAVKDVSFEVRPGEFVGLIGPCLLYTSPSPRDVEESRMPSSA